MSFSDSTLMSCTKKELLDHYRVMEKNNEALKEGSNIQYNNIIKFNKEIVDKLDAKIKELSELIDNYRLNYAETNNEMYRECMDSFKEQIELLEWVKNFYKGVGFNE